MKKRIVILCVLLCVLCGMSFVVVGIATGLIGTKETAVYDLNIEDNNTDKYIQYTISEGSLDISEELEGNVIYDENAIKVIEQTAAKSNVEIHFGVGQKVNKDDVICTNGTTVIKAPVSGKIIDVKRDEKITITMVDYTQSVIKASVSEEYQDKVNSVTSIYASYNGAEEIAMEISSISPVIEEGVFDIFFVNKFEAFDNSKVKIRINYETKDNVVIVPKEFISFDNSKKAYIKIMNEYDEIKKIYVSLGSENSSTYELLDAYDLIGKTAVVDKEEIMIKGSE